MQATILLAHGSRDPLWRIPMEKVAQCMREFDPQVQVRCAFLELTEPTMEVAVAELISIGARDITIVPMFLGIGKHAREDMPILVNGMKATYPETSFQLNPSVGEDTRVIELLARIAMPSH
jgi:sirohydrochlorin cobaltochelatase